MSFNSIDLEMFLSVEAAVPTTPNSQVSPRDDVSFPPGKEGEKQRKKLDKEMKARAKEAERKKIKDEKRRQKEEEKQAKETRKAASNKLKASNSVQVQPTLDDFRASAEDPIPLFLRKAITFIEKEGLDAEGLYRVPGNRAHVDLLFQNFDEDPKVDIDELDIAVNAVATAVKDFFFKRLPPVLGPDHMAELETISRKKLHLFLSSELLMRQYIFLHSDSRSKHQSSGAGQTDQKTSKNQLCRAEIHFSTFCQVRFILLRKKGLFLIRI